MSEYDSEVLSLSSVLLFTDQDTGVARTTEEGEHLDNHLLDE